MYSPYVHSSVHIFVGGMIPYGLTIRKIEMGLCLIHVIFLFFFPSSSPLLHFSSTQMEGIRPDDKSLCHVTRYGLFVEKQEEHTPWSK